MLNKLRRFGQPTSEKCDETASETKMINYLTTSIKVKVFFDLPFVPFYDI